MLKAVDRERARDRAHRYLQGKLYLRSLYQEYRYHRQKWDRSDQSRRRADGVNQEAFEIAPGVLSTGWSRAARILKSGIGTYNLVDGAISGDKIEDDLSIVVNVKDVGLVVLVGCSHAGIVNIVTHAKELTGIDRVEAVMGGFHLIEAPAERIARTAEALKEMEINRVVAGHCTGLKACAELGRVLEDRFQLLHSGKILNVP